jgi:hypothetical protein
MMFSLPKVVRIAQSAYQQLERLDGQFSTLTTAACLLEGKGWLALAEVDIIEAAAAFMQAVTR